MTTATARAVCVIRGEGVSGAVHFEQVQGVCSEAVAAWAPRLSFRVLRRVVSCCAGLCVYSLQKTEDAPTVITGEIRGLAPVRGP